VPPRNFPNLLAFEEHPPSPYLSGPSIGRAQTRCSEVARFKCDHCSQTFTTSHNLKNHVNVHSRVKQHSCGSCGRGFTTQSVLARHLRMCKAAQANRDS
jgi:uncharacterized Zn-finger protein